MKYIYTIILIYSLIALAGTLKGFSVLSNSDTRLERIISSQTVANYRATKGCE